MDIKNKILPTVKLKHLHLMAASTPDYKEIMTEVIGYKNNWFTRKFQFIKQFKVAYLVTNEMRNINPENLEWQEKTCPIKKPTNVDFITFQAMMELQALLGEGASEENMLQVITQSIAIVCYSENNEGDYKSDGQEFEDFKNKILNYSFKEMFGLYNWIVKDVQRSVDDWNNRFFSVEVEDKDYHQAGGSRMSQFNVINTIKSICEDFNLPFKEAWQMSYNLVQTNSYSKATQSHIQDNMRQIKEARMKASRT
jgi:hypothetical protein